MLVGCSDSAAPALDAATDVVVDVVDGADVAVSPDAVDPLCAMAPVTPAAFVRDPRARPMDAALRLNHLQSKGTHNSYHLRPANDQIDWAYSHRPLAEQLGSQGVRGVELDLQWNDTCQRIQVFHLPIIDARTTCLEFTDCLMELRTWSAAHPGHQPIFVHIEPKFAPSPETDEMRMLEAEREILSVFSRDWIITPDEVRGASPTLREAITTRGWPSLGATRGRFLFYIDNSDSVRVSYTHGLQNLNGRLMFVDSAPEDPFAGVMILNDPMTSAAAITRALSMGFLVRTRADSDPNTARTNDVRQRDAAFASGAQIVSTDFPARVDGMPYVVEIPSGTPSRCSPVTAPMGCTASAIEDPTTLAR